MLVPLWREALIQECERLFFIFHAAIGPKGYKYRRTQIDHCNSHAHEYLAEAGSILQVLLLACLGWIFAGLFLSLKIGSASSMVIEVFAIATVLIVFSELPIIC